MILRSPTVSETLTSLVVPGVQDAAGRAKSSLAGDGKKGTSIASIENADRSRAGLRVIDAPSEALPAKEPAPRELSFEEVVAWLAVQTAETRTACAAILATEVAHTYESAKLEGFAAGKAAGEAVAADELQKALAVFARMAEEAESAFEADCTQLQGMSVDIVSEALTKIGGHALAAPEATVACVREVLARVRESREILIRVSREDLPVLQAHLDDLLLATPGRKLELLPDARVELGGCIVETKMGSLDGRLEAQLRELFETLRIAKSSTPELP